LSDYNAVVDIGTNSFHLIIAELPGDGKVKTIHREKVVMRLGTEGKDVLGKISPAETERALEVLNNFKKLAEFYGAELKAVATSAVREAENKDEFLSAVKEKAGITIEVIDGKKEASLIYLGVQNALPVHDKKILCIDIGGGSTEVIIGHNGESNFIQSYKLGAVRLSKMFFPEFIISSDAVKECAGYIQRKLYESDIRNFVGHYDIAVGASGTIMAIASVIAEEKYDAVPEDLNGFSFNVEELKSATATIFKYATFEERTAIPGMEAARADILPAGALILLKLFRILEMKSITISSYSLREGYLLSLKK
jgi:exopolyphosphatase / guanosine-5'-triphosphate,3'-diphosphate pyrophosphatase